jgi:hypothetical protein
MKNEERMNELDARLRTVEQAVVEIATTTKYLKVLIVFIAASFGIDLSAVM